MPVEETKKEDVFRQVYTPIAPEVSTKILEIKAKAQELYDLMTCECREMSVAKTNLETSIMWAIKGLTK